MAGSNDRDFKEDPAAGSLLTIQLSFYNTNSQKDMYRKYVGFWVSNSFEIRGTQKRKYFLTEYDQKRMQHLYQQKYGLHCDVYCKWFFKTPHSPTLKAKIHDWHHTKMCSLFIDVVDGKCCLSTQAVVTWKDIWVNINLWMNNLSVNSLSMTWT